MQRVMCGPQLTSRGCYAVGTQALCAVSGSTRALGAAKLFWVPIFDQCGPVVGSKPIFRIAEASSGPSLVVGSALPIM